MSDEDLLDIKQLLADYFAKKLIAEADQIWEDRGWTNETMEEFGKGHLRTAVNEFDTSFFHHGVDSVEGTRIPALSPSA